MHAFVTLHSCCIGVKKLASSLQIPLLLLILPVALIKFNGRDIVWKQEQ